MDTDSLRELSEKFLKQTEDGMNAMIAANVDPREELKALVTELRDSAGRGVACVEPAGLTPTDVAQSQDGSRNEWERRLTSLAQPGRVAV